MNQIHSSEELAAACKRAAGNFKTLYVRGAFGWPMTEENKQRARNAYAYNRQAARVKKITGADGETFGFDCVCFVKALLWGWQGDTSSMYGGAVYKSNGVPDINESAMLSVCTDVSTDFSRIQVGEYLWRPGHCGIYVGGGLAVECTPAWADGVQITAVHNIGKKPGYNGRAWTKHGKLPYVTYETKGETEVKLQELKKGAKGDPVKALQVLLIGYGYGCGIYGADGDFGSATDAAVRAYQKAGGLAVDGIVGPKTWARLLGVK